MINEEARLLLKKIELPEMYNLIDELANYDRLLELYTFRDAKRKEAH